MTINKTYFLICFVIFNLSFCFSQDRQIDSLKNLLKTAKDTNKVNILINISRRYFNEEIYDSSLVYSLQSKVVAEKLNFKRGMSLSYNLIGTNYHHNGNLLEALNINFKALSIRIELKDKKAIATTYNNIGIAYYDLGNLDEALKNHLTALKLREEINEQKGKITSYSNIGNVYVILNNLHDALKYYQLALKTSISVDDKLGIAGSYNNIAYIFNTQKKYQLALNNSLAALKIREEIGNKSGIADSYLSIGVAYKNLGKLKEAYMSYFLCIKLTDELKDEKGIIDPYESLSELYSLEKKYDAAEMYINKALFLANKFKMLEFIKRGNEIASIVYANTGNYVKALDSYKASVIASDSLNNKENTKKTVQSQMQYEFDKKESATKLEQEKKDIVSLAESKKQSIILWSVFGILVLVIAFAIFIFRSYIQKQKINEDITQQKYIIEEKQKEILDSIHYAKRIQNALLTSEKYIDRSLNKLNKN